jgi:hypothetical protein
MNNDYDRGEQNKSDTIITGEGFIVPREGNEDMIVDLTPIVSVKLIVFLNGEQVLAEVEENFGNNTITLTNPIGVMVSAVEDADDSGDYKTTVSYGSWLPLAADRSIVIERSSIIAITDPIESLVESYLGDVNG